MDYNLTAIYWYISTAELIYSNVSTRDVSSNGDRYYFYAQMQLETGALIKAVMKTNLSDRLKAY